MARTPIVGTIGFGIQVDDSGFIQQLRKAGERGKRELEGTTTAADRLADQLREAGEAGERAMRGIANQTDRAGDLMAKAAKNASLLRNTVSAAFFSLGVISRVDTVAKFAQSISTLEAVSGAAGAELESLRDKALALGGSTRFSATQAADAMGELARAGFSANEVLAAIGPTLTAAQAGGAGLAETAEIIGTTIRGFGIDATDAARVADVLAQASNASNAGIIDLGEALKFAAPTAKQLGLELEDTVAIIGKLSDGGLKGGLAGRGFQSIATQLINNRKEVEKLIGSFNLAEDGLGNVVKRLVEAGITTEQVIKIFRAENLDTFGIISTSAIEGSLASLEALLDNAAGSSARAAAIMDDNLNGALLGLSSRIEALVIAIGDAGASAGLQAALDGLSALLQLAAENADFVQAAMIGMAIKAVIPLIGFLGRKVIALQAVKTQLAILDVQLAKSTTTMQRFGAAGAFAINLLGPMTLAVLAASAAYVVLARESAEAKERIAATTATINQTREVIEALDAIIANQNPFVQMADDAGIAERAIEAVTGATDALTLSIKEATNETRRNALLQLGTQLGDVSSKIKEIEAERDKIDTINRERGITSDRFERSERGQQLRRLEQERAALLQRVRPLRQGLFLNDNFDDVVATANKIKAIEANIAKLREAGIETGSTLLDDQLKTEKAVLGFLQKGLDLATATQLARENRGSTAGAADGAASSPLSRDQANAAKKLGDSFTKDLESPLEALQRWRTEQLDAIAAVAASEAERATLRNQLDNAFLFKQSELLAAEAEVGIAAVKAEADKQQAIAETLAARDAEIDLRIAEAQGDEAAIKALQDKADFQARYNDLVKAGLDAEQATVRATAEIARLKAGELSETALARREFVDGLSGDISSALLNAVRSGDYGAVFQEVLNASAARGLEDAINELADEFANFAGNLIFGANGTGGLLSGVLGGVGTPPILDAATAGAATDAVKGAAETAAAASVTTLGAAAAGGAASVTALAAAETAGAASATALATALAAASLAAQAAASALAAVATSQGGSLAADVIGGLTFGGGRANGGPVMPGKFYEVNEGGLPELLSMGSRKFLLPGSSGDVTPLAGSTLPAPQSREIARHEIYVQGTGNAEIQRAVDLGVQRSIKIARAQAGPAAAEFQTRKV